MNVLNTIVDGPLGIYIITYNRSNDLRQTLTYIENSALRNFPITVLDNCSTDDTIVIVNGFMERIPTLGIVSNRFNIGLGANFLKTFDLGNFTYTWVLCDDDVIDAPDITDVLQVIKHAEVDLIHVGAHKEKVWPFGGQISTPKELLNQGYPYFKFSSFIPCNIFKTELFVKEFIVRGYENVVNAYPHMPFLFDVYHRNSNIYVSKRQLVVAKPSNSGYAPKIWYKWWMKTCELLLDKNDVRLAYLDQWKDIGTISDSIGIDSLMDARRLMVSANEREYFNYFVNKYFYPADKLKIIFHILGVYKMKRKILNLVKR